MEKKTNEKKKEGEKLQRKEARQKSGMSLSIWFVYVSKDVLWISNELENIQ